VRSWRFLLGILISAVFLIYAFRGQDYGAIFDALKGVRYWLLIPALGLYFCGVIVRTYRWSILLSPLKKISVRDLLPITVIGFMANNVLPLRTGEVVRSYVLNKNYGVRKTAALTTIAVERIFDGITMVGFILIAAITVNLTHDLRHVVNVASILFAVAVTGLAIATFARDLRETLLQFGLRFVPIAIRGKVEHMAESFFTGLESLRSPRLMGAVALSSVVAWGFEASMYWVIAAAFGGSVQDVMGFSETLLTTGIANLATLVPSSPGYVGPFEAAIKTVLNGALDVDAAQALSYAILVHACLWFPVTVWGAIEWSRMHLSMSQVREESGPVAPEMPNASASMSQSSTSVHTNAA
jgi:uncharacterized protein (TIRG00374 family)